MDKCAEELARCQSSLTELSRLLQSLEILQRTQSAPNFIDMQANCVELSKKEKRLNRRWRTKSVGKDAKFQLQVPLSASMSPVRLHSSNPNLCAELVDFQPPVSSRLTDSVEYASDYIKLQEEFCTIAQKAHSLLKSAFNTVAIEKEKIKQILSEQDQSDQSVQINSLRKSLSLALSQNAELRSRLNRIHSESILTEQVVSVNIIATPDEAVEQMGIPLTQQASNESRLSMSESVSEFFDAQEVLLSASSSENEGSDDESYVSDVSDNISEDNASVTDNVSRQMANGDFAGSSFRNGRRICLPAPCPDTSNINLWNILRNNIGKDLSKVSMPVELNEPLNTLQRMCEELEYSELLDRAACCDSALDQMCLVAAFSVSSYSTTVHRTAKPFNPLLGETYELDRLEEYGYRSISEQVSHHPPAAAHHVASQRGWTLWQHITIDSKFRGKYISVMPFGNIHLQFHSNGNHYVWSKVTSTVHNIIVGKLWIDQSGDIDIVNTTTKDTCHLKFSPYSYFSREVPRKVTGVVEDREGAAHYILSGTWDNKMESAKIVESSQGCGGSEGKQKTVYQTLQPKLLWKKYPLPENAENMHFFSSLALTLNEPEEGVAPTDSRLRPDQRLMEAGLWDEANIEKQRLEEHQRLERKRREAQANQALDEGQDIEGYQPVWFEKRTDDCSGESTYVYRGGYWEAKDRQDWSLCPEIF
uniref:Oxysterol-binding protein n=1 Tax=Nothobranchius korthausae TaxID=1143690 RepID=A0A1A8H9F7_9TELE